MGILNFPIEILDEIFMNACIVDFHIIIDDELGRITNPFLLGAVCTAWRDIVWSTSRLWSIMVLQISKKQYCAQLKLLDLWLANSKSHPLFIYFDVLDSGFERNPPLQALMKIVDECERWECIDICLIDDAKGKFRSVLEEVECRVPLLQTLNFRQYQGDENFEISTTRLDMFKYSPRLRNFAVNLLYRGSFTLPWAQLTTFHGQIQSMKECTEVLSGCPNLVQCHFIEIHWCLHDEKYDPSSPPSRIVMSRLTSLNILNTGDDAISYILDKITCPVLRELHVDSTPSYDSTFKWPVDLPWSMIEIFLARSRCLLEILDMASGSFGKSALDIIRNIPTIRKLYLTEDLTKGNPRSVEFLTSLVKVLVTEGFLPQLTNLRFTGHMPNKATVAIPQILEMLRARWDTNTLGVSRLVVLNFQLELSDNDNHTRLDKKILKGYGDVLKNAMRCISIAIISELDLLYRLH